MLDLQLRALPSTGAFTTPHVQSFQGVQFFYQLLEQQVADVHRRAAELGGDNEALIRAAVEGALQRQALSEAVQVFCAMAVEAAVNLLGLLSLGEEQFRTQVEYKPHLEKLKILLRLIDRDSTERAQLLLAVAKRLANARKSFVHPKAREGEPRLSTDCRRGDVESARQAMSDVHQFFELLRECNQRYSVFFNFF